MTEQDRATSFAGKFSDPHEAKLWAQVVALAPFMFQAALSLRNLGVLKALTEDGIEFGELRRQTELSEYALGVLLDSGVASGLIEVRDGRYYSTLAGHYIQSDRITNINMNFTQDVCYQGLHALEASLRAGRPEGLKVFGDWQTIYAGLTQLPEKALSSWFDFDHYFSDDAFPRVMPFIFSDRPRRLLDVGGNTGKFAAACAKFDPSIEVTILDHSAQLELALNRAKELGFANRVHGSPMDLLDHERPFPEGFDVIWMSQFLDCFGKEDVLALMKRAARAMSPSSRFFILEPFTDRQKYEASRFTLDMTSLYFTSLANGQSRFYRAADFHELLAAAGLEVEAEHGPIRLSHTLLRCKLSEKVAGTFSG